MDVKLKEQDMLFAGFGGQGLQLSSLLLTIAAANEGKNALHYSEYTGEVRGGIIICTVVVADAERQIFSPKREKAQVVVAMSRSAFQRYENAVRPGGYLFVNSSLIPTEASRDDITAVYIPFNDLAREAGDERTLSMVLVGAIAQKLGTVSVQSLLDATPEVFPPHRQRLVPTNQKAIAKGAEFVQRGA